MDDSTSLSQEDSDPPPAVSVSGNQDVRAPTAILKRVLTGAALLAAATALLWIDSRQPYGLALMLAALAFTAGGLFEYCRLAEEFAPGVRLSRLLITTTGLALVLGMWAGWAFGGQPDCPFWLSQPGMTAAALMGLVALTVLAARALAGRVEGVTQAASLSLLGLAYVALPLALLGALRVRLGPTAIVAVIAVSKATDIGGYFAGKLIGGARLAPVVSPRKTVAGALGGVALATAVAVALALAGLSPMGVLLALLYGPLMALVNIAGDLSESVLKRQAGAKDSGNLLPGQGVLDMMDGLLFGVPFTCVFFLLFPPTG